MTNLARALPRATRPSPHAAGRAADGLHPIGRRVLEVLPPAVVWLALTAPVWGALLAPHLLGWFLVAFSAYWLWRSSEFGIGLLLGIWRLRRALGRDWAREASQLPDYDQLRYLVIVPTYRESVEILAQTLDCLAQQSVTPERIAVVLGFEERDRGAPARAGELTAAFRSRFGEWLVTFHPDLPGEVKGKSSNLAWAAQRVEDELIATGRLDAHDLLVTVCDADSRLHPQYLAALSHTVQSHPDGRLHVYQPAILFYANHHRLPPLLRAVSSVFSLYSLSRLAATHRLVPQSTYSLSWSTARRVGFWDVDVIPEDSHMFFKVWLHVGRQVRARAIHLPVYADAAEGPSTWLTATSTYQQIRRWAWGVSDVPYIALRALRARHIPWHIRVARVGWYVEEHLVWPSHWFLLTLGGLVPQLLNTQYASTALAIWQRSAMSTLLGLCLPSLIAAILADAVLTSALVGGLGPRPSLGRGLVSFVVGLVGFAILPLTGLALVALPALDAHTRLLFGRSLAYQVTAKVPTRATPRALGAVAPLRDAA